MLDEAETARRARFAHLRHAVAYSQSRSWMRRILGRYLGRRAADVPLGSTQNAKPLLVGLNAMFDFNLSHTDSLVMLAVSRCAVGVDVERSDSLPDIRAGASRVFTSYERKACEATEGQKDLLRYWVAKEAVLKAWGAGFTIDPKQAQVRLGKNGSGVGCIVTDAGPERSYLKFGTIDRLHTWAVASRTPICRVRVQKGEAGRACDNR